MAMRLAFLKDDRTDARAALPLFDELIMLLIGGGRKRLRCQSKSGLARSDRIGLAKEEAMRLASGFLMGTR